MIVFSTIPGTSASPDVDAMLVRDNSSPSFCSSNGDHFVGDEEEIDLSSPRFSPRSPHFGASRCRASAEAKNDQTTSPAGANRISWGSAAARSSAPRSTATCSTIAGRNSAARRTTALSPSSAAQHDQREGPPPAPGEAGSLTTSSGLGCRAVAVNPYEGFLYNRGRESVRGGTTRHYGGSIFSSPAMQPLAAVSGSASAALAATRPSVAARAADAGSARHQQKGLREYCSAGTQDLLHEEHRALRDDPRGAGPPGHPHDHRTEANRKSSMLRPPLPPRLPSSNSSAGGPAAPAGSSSALSLLGAEVHKMLAARELTEESLIDPLDHVGGDVALRRERVPPGDEQERRANRQKQGSHDEQELLKKGRRETLLKKWGILSGCVGGTGGSVGDVGPPPPGCGAFGT